MDDPLVNFLVIIGHLHFLCSGSQTNSTIANVYRIAEGFPLSIDPTVWRVFCACNHYTADCTVESRWGEKEEAIYNCNGLQLILLVMAARVILSCFNQ